MINNNYKRSIENVAVKKRYLYYSEGSWTYNHHASITFFNGKFYVMWSNGKTNEDDIGQRILYTWSVDGESWAKPTVLFDSMDGNAVLTAGGWYSSGDKLIAYAGLFYYTGSLRPEGDKNHMGTTLLYKESTDGINFGNAVDLGLPIVPNQGPKKLNSGRILICGSIMYPYSDVADGISGWTVAGLSPMPFENMRDDSEGFQAHAILRQDKEFVCEGSFFEKDDKLFMLLRNIKSDRLFVSYGASNGDSWTDPVPTEFSNDNSKFYCMKLSNGKYCVVSNPVIGGGRRPLTLSLSDDCENFSVRCDIATEKLPMRYDGMYKGGVYGYPNAIEKDGKLYVVCSINKEDVMLLTLSVDSLK